MIAVTANFWQLGLLNRDQTPRPNTLLMPGSGQRALGTSPRRSTLALALDVEEQRCAAKLDAPTS